MTQSGTGHLRKSPLDAHHRAAGARMEAVGGWVLPAEFSGAAEEYTATRSQAALFDLSHLGQVEVAGRDAVAALQWLTSIDVAALQTGQARDGALTAPEGGCVDLVRIHRLAETHFLLFVSADGAARDVAWILQEAARFKDVIAIDTSARYALFAIHGPGAREALQQATEIALADLEPGRFASGEVTHARVTIACAEGLGESGYYVLVPPQQAPAAWKAVLEAGRDDGLVPAGMCARDTLRIEAGEREHGVDVDASTSLVEAGMPSRIAWDKGDFLGRDALDGQRQAGPTRLLAGFVAGADDDVAPGSAAIAEGKPLGRVTSAVRSPSLGTTIGFVFMPARLSAPGTPFEISLDGRLTGVRVAPLPFYNRTTR